MEKTNVSILQPKILKSPHNKSIKDLEKEAMKYEYLMERQMQKYFRDQKNNQEALKIAIRASKEAHRRWQKIAFLEKMMRSPFSHT